MLAPGHAASLEEQIDRWRSYLRRRQAIHAVDIAELEDHLREQIAVLTDAGLASDEAFLVAVKRLGDLDALSREFAREHSECLWKQLVVSSSDAGEPPTAARTEAIVAVCLAAAAALAIRVPVLFGLQLDADAGWYARNLSFFVLPLLAGYFAWKCSSRHSRPDVRFGSTPMRPQMCRPRPRRMAQLFSQMTSRLACPSR